MITAESASADACSLATAPHTAGRRFAYLLSQYPARSHTFLLHEVLGLRARGLHIEVAAVNAPDRSLDELPVEEAAEARATFYLKQGNRLGLVLSVCFTAIAHPLAVVRGLRAISRLPAMPLRRRAFWLFYLAEALLLGRWMKRRDLSHLHVHFGGAVASVGMLTSVAWSIPYSLTIHGPEELLDPGGYQLAAKLHQACFVVCISEFCRGELRRMLHAGEWAKLTVIQLGVDPGLLLPRVAACGSEKKQLTLVCVGRLVATKGHSILLQALRLLRDQNVDMQAVLIGTGAKEAELRRYVAEQRLGERVTFTAGLSHADTLAHVRTADIFALASFAEGVPVALMEAMSLEVPCVSTTIAGIPELIESGRDGLLVAPGDVVALADTLTLLAQDEALRRRLGTAGRQRVLDGYNLPHNLDRLAQFLRDASEPSHIVQPAASHTRLA